jgi:nitroreductase
MINTTELLQNHASIRSFTNQPLTEKQRNEIFKAAIKLHRSVYYKWFL